MSVPPAASVPLCLLMTAAVAVWWVRRLRRTDETAYRATLGQSRFRWLVLAFAAVMFVDTSSKVQLAPTARSALCPGASAAGSQLGALMIIGGIIGCLFGGWLADRWRGLQTSGRVWTALIAVLAEGAAILSALGQSDYPAFVFAFAAFCLASGGCASGAAIAFDIVPQEHRGSGTSAYFLVTTVLGPGITRLASWTGQTSSITNTALAWHALLAIAAAALIKLGRLLNEPAAPPRRWSARRA